MRWESKDAVAVVTGATSGIGRCLATRLVDSGSTVVATGRREDRLSQLASELGSRLIPVAGDLTEPTVRQRVVTAAEIIRDGQVDLLVNNAGVGAIGPFADAAAQRLRTVMEVNFFAPVELTRLLLPSLRRGRAPVICNVGSVLGHRAVPNKSEYCASKFAMHGWSDSLRAELVDDDIQITLVSPSTTESEFFDALVDTESSQRSKSFGSWTADKVAETAIAAIRSRRSEVICSLAGKLLVYGDRLSPPLMNAVVAKIK
jgi:short-subunit dehydrogenase